FHTLNDSPVYRATKLPLAKNSTLETVTAAVNPAVELLLGDAATQDSSSLLQGLANGLAEDKVKAGDHVTVVSDLYENTKLFSLERLKRKQEHNYVDP